MTTLRLPRRGGRYVAACMMALHSVFEFSEQHARHKALGKILDVGNYHLEKGYVLGATNVSQKSNFLNKNDPTSAMKTIQLPQSPR